MKLLLVIAFIVCTLAAHAHGESGVAEPNGEYLPPAMDQAVADDSSDSAQLADDGYRYKTVRRLRFRARHRRDLSQEYLPPVNEPSQEYLPPTSGAAETPVADDGYRYKTVRRLRYRARHRRDVSELAPPAPSSEYLPPVNVELAPDLKTVVGDDGYRYRTVRRLKYRRHRREADSAAEPTNEYLPPVESEAPAEANDSESESAQLATDGYRYKTVRRIRYRYRH